MTSNELITLLASQPHWQARYRQLLILPTHLPTLTDHDDRYVVEGCENRVWIKITPKPDGTFMMWGDSDGRIVKGLVCIVIILTQNKTTAEIEALDFGAQFKRMKLTHELSHSRWVGLEKIIAHVIAETRQTG